MSDNPVLDTTDLDRHMGVPMRPGELNDDVSKSDIRRWVQAMHYPNPLHYDERWAAESRFGGLVAPQSFTVATDTSHGCSPAQVGRIPNSHLIFGGDEWWFFGPRIHPGDHLVCHRMPYDYKVTDTQLRRPDLLPAGRHDLHQPARRAHRAAALDGHSLPGPWSEGEEGLRPGRATPSGPTPSLPTSSDARRRSSSRSSSSATTRACSRASRSATACPSTCSARTASPASPPSGGPTR